MIRTPAFWNLTTYKENKMKKKTTEEKTHKISAAGREAIAEAQRKRWRKFRREQKAVAKSGK